MDSIRNVLEIVRNLANEYMQNLDRRADDWVVLTNAADGQGAMNEMARDKVVMSLYSITHESVVSTLGTAPRTAGGNVIAAPPLYLDIHLIFLANFAGHNYGEGLAAISRTISFFQQNPVFTRANAPDLDPSVDTIELVFTNLDVTDVQRVMAMLGVHYLPSVFYTLRMLPFASQTMQART